MAGGVGWRVGPFSQTIPPGAGPGDPRIVIGSDIPPGLVAYYATGPWDGNPETVIEATIYYGVGGVPYEWDALVLNPIGWGDGPIRAFGRFDPFSLNVYKEIFRLIGDSVEFLPGTILTSRGSIAVQSPGSLATYGKAITGQGATLAQAGVVGSRASTTFANIPGNPSLTITKIHGAASTDLLCRYSITCFSAAVNNLVQIAVNTGAGAAVGGKLFFNVANSHTTLVGVTRLTGLGAGGITVNLQWATSGGAFTAQQDTNDWDTLDISEVAVQ